MNCSPTLTAEEFKTVHNALWHLDRAVAQLEETIHPSLFKELSTAARDIREGLKGAYAQDSAAFDSKHEMFSRVREQYGLKTTWSIYEVDSMTQLHCYGDAQYVVYDQHWGDGEVVKKIEGLDWLSLYRAADAAIRASGDGHHSFIEAFTPIKDKPGYLRLTTGS